MRKDDIKLGEAVSMGIGGMVGGGIFAVLGLAISLSKGGTPVAFMLAGIITLLTAYAYSKLSLKYPSKGGTVNFINQAFGKTIFSGGANNLLWISYIIMLSLYSSAFGSYAGNLFHVVSDPTLNKHLFISGIIIFSTILNYLSVRVVAEAESVAVYIKMTILTLFIIIGGYGLFHANHLTQFEFNNWTGPVKLFSGGMVIFVAYEGFELIANASSDIVNPKKNIPRSYFIAISIVILLYVLISFVTVASLSFDKIQKAQEYVLAEAAKPELGHIGFTIITLAAMISTFTAINSTLFGGSRVNYELGIDDELPHEFTKHFWNQPVGLLFTSAFTLLIANTLDLESISTSGSAGFLIIFAIVNLANVRLYKETASKRYISIAGFVMCSVAFLFLLKNQLTNNFWGMIISLGIIATSFAMEYIYKATEKKKKTESAYSKD
ncbi:APC family permease [Prolixibacter denitrificans]|uniref:Amino acid permease n=1 Tax=Prolixibacter denitrificans TaxID=1541063 RepID=A0A2P8CJU2_9BACT|nr:APC family permease [Prolixibacter denitrificans]PSK85236.1 amino acid permease [Prolixibacter denitrificans]GET19858.1 amino acid transporter [Prolixibacter denitrificans]